MCNTFAFFFPCNTFDFAIPLCLTIPPIYNTLYRNTEFVSERDVWWPNCLDTAMVSGEGFKSSDGSVVVELGEIGSGSKSTRRGVWVPIEDYWPYPANSPLQDVRAEGCNSDSESDSESNSNDEVDLKILD